MSRCLSPVPWFHAAVLTGVISGVRPGLSRLSPDSKADGRIIG